MEKKLNDCGKKKKKTTLKKYQKFVIGLMSPQSTETQRDRLAVAGLGLSGEAGEFADIVKKVLFHGMELTDEVRQKMVKELGDQMFYLTFAAVAVCETDLRTVIEANVEKLSDRYKTGKFTTEEFLKKENQKKS